MAKPQPQKAPPRTSQKEEPKQELVQRAAENTQQVAVQDDIPDYIKRGGGRGSENVDMGDVVIPRIEVVQALSKCLKESDPAYIDGIRVGDLFNTVTREIYGPAVKVVPVLFKKEWLAWRDQDEGGGFAGAYNSQAECQKRIDEEEKPEQWEATETAQQLVYVVKQDGSSEEAMVSMNKTKLKVSRQWNTLIRLHGNDRFSRMYILHSVDETNSANKDYKNFGIYDAGYPPADVYKKAEALYDAVRTGARTVKMDTSEVDGTGADTRGTGEY